MARYRIGTDIGGTFTDLCVLEEENGEFFNLKVLSTPKDLTQGVIEALDQYFHAGRKPEDARLLSHATTVATNALLEQKGGDTWLVITEGFSGIYETPELSQIRPGAYDYLCYPKPRLLVPQRKTIEIPERVDAQGRVVTTLDEAAARERLSALAQAHAESVAVCFLFSFLNDQHEQRVRQLIHEIAPAAQVYLSSEVLPQIREYTRLATTVTNAYVAPVVTRYVDRLERALSERGFRRRLYIMQSTGGSLTTGVVKKIPVQIIESGPAAGVLAAAHIGRLTGNQKVISFDMGGTTAKAGLIEAGEPRVVSRFQAGEWLLGVPSLDLVEIGSGGGSIAWIDASAMLKVGPQSAGADPGPACYPNGGKAPTVTDADVVLGWLNPDFFLGGRMKLNGAAAKQAIETRIAQPLALDLINAADGIVKIVNSQMVEALRLVTVARGEDPREYALVAFGGCGPVHAAKLAEELQIGRVIVPPAPGVASAMGLLVADFKRDYIRTRIGDLATVTAAQVQTRFEELEQAARDELQGEKISAEEIRFARALDLRYAIQKYELSVPVGCGALHETDKPNWRRLFDERHEQQYGTRASDQKVEIVNYHLTAILPVPRPEPKPAPFTGESAKNALRGRRRAYFDAWLDCPVYAREKLACGNRVAGPAIVEQEDSTTVIHPGQNSYVDPFGNIVIEVSR
ncbi:MAG: hydantoinase/oxoprolinase family protein [Deltaproteobacteria bacterium]|nr:hydantoinase/oxoprolinase family protein [Deltaproteobacteria bacterium]